MVQGETRMKYILDFDIAAVCISCITLFLFYERKQRRFGPGESYGRIAWTVLLSSVFSAASSYFANALPGTSGAATMATVTLFYLFHNSIAFFAAVYILNYGGLLPVKKTMRVLLALPWAIAIAAVASNPITRLISYVDSANVYRRGPFFFILYLLSTLYFLIIIAALFFKRSHYRKSHQRAFLAAALAPGLAALIQGFSRGLMLECFGASVSALLALITIQNASELMDGQSGLYHRESFIEFLAGAFKKKEPFTVLIAHSPELADLQGSLEMQNYRALVAQVSKWMFQASGAGAAPSWVGTGVFGLLFSRRLKSNPVGDLALKILDLADASWSVGSLHVKVPFKVTILQCPEDAADISDVVDCIDQIAEVARHSAHKKIYTKFDFSVGKHKRSSAVAAALERCLERESPELFYQPVYSIERSKPFALEVLLGLSLVNNEQAFQSEVLSTAEKMGVSRQLTELTLKKAFEWHAANKQELAGIDQLQLRLVSSMCLDLDWPRTVLKTAADARMDLSKVCFEITETTVSRFGNDLAMNMELLTGKGVSFALDDFGSGYTNLVKLAPMPFSIIKFDKKIIQPGLQSNKGRQLVEGMVDIFKKRECAVAAEGVETEAQAGILALMNFDHLQGYLFGKPMSGQRIVEALKNG